MRQVIDECDGVRETRLTGAIAWVVNGNIACAVVGEDLFVRVDTGAGDRILAEACVRPTSLGARTLRDVVTVDSNVIADDAALARWVHAGAEYAAWLAPG